MVNYDQLVGYLEDEKISLENCFQLGKATSNFLAPKATRIPLPKQIFKEVPIQSLDSTLFTIVKRFESRFVLIACSIDLKEYETLPQRLESSDHDEGKLIEGLQLKIAMNICNSRSKDIFKISEPSKKVSVGDLLTSVGRRKVTDSVFFSIRRKLYAGSIPKVHRERLVRLFSTILSVNQEGLQIGILGNILSAMGSLVLSPKSSNSPRSPKSKSGGAFPFHLMARWATKLHRPALLRIKKADPRHAHEVKELPTSTIPESNFIAELEFMNHFYLYQFFQNGFLTYLSVKIHLPSTFVKSQPSLEITTYR